MAINYSPSLLPSPVRQLRPSQTRSSPPNPPALRLSPFFFKKKNIFAFFIFCLCISVLVFVSPTKASRSLLVFFASIWLPAVCLKFWTNPRLFSETETFFWNWVFPNLYQGFFPNQIPKLFSGRTFSETDTKTFFWGTQTREFLPILDDLFNSFSRFLATSLSTKQAWSSARVTSIKFQHHEWISEL